MSDVIKVSEQLVSDSAYLAMMANDGFSNHAKHSSNYDSFGHIRAKFGCDDYKCRLSNEALRNLLKNIEDTGTLEDEQIGLISGAVFSALNT
jgi:hypothetical protein